MPEPAAPPVRGGGFGGAGATLRWEEPTERPVLLLTREALRAGSGDPTLGILSAPGLVGPIHTLELPWRNNEPRVSCIPEGEFRVVLVPSVRFKGRVMPRLLGVPGRSGILFHGGNDEHDTVGCILVGRERTVDGHIRDCAPALEALLRWLTRATVTGTVTCRIVRLPAVAA